MSRGTSRRRRTSRARRDTGWRARLPRRRSSGSATDNREGSISLVETLVDAPPPLRSRPTPSYAHAHWYFLAALAVIVVGFWPSFFRRPLGLGIAHRIHGITATLWILTLATQSWLMARGRVVAHRRVARGAFVLMPVMCVSALYMVRTMQTNPQMPPGLPALLGFVDLFSIAFLATLFGLALGHVHRPGAHKRFMAATVLLGFPPALTRLFLWTAGVGFMPALHASFVVTEVVLVALLVSDRRNGERHLAYRLSLAFFVLLQALMVPVSGTGAWQALMAALG